MGNTLLNDLVTKPPRRSLTTLFLSLDFATLV